MDVSLSIFYLLSHLLDLTLHFSQPLNPFFSFHLQLLHGLLEGGSKLGDLLFHADPFLLDEAAEVFISVFDGIVLLFLPIDDASLDLHAFLEEATHLLLSFSSFKSSCSGFDFFYFVSLSSIDQRAFHTKVFGLA